MASTKTWFESVAEAQRRAKKRLPASVYGALIAGAESGVTVDDNTAAFRELGFFPRIATGQDGNRDLSTTIQGTDVSMPVMISPTGVQAVHPEGEIAVGRAAAHAGIAQGLSSFASKSMEDVIAVNDKLFFQMYWMGDRDRLLQIMDRARNAGVKGIILTLDWTFAHRRDWGSPEIPAKIDAKTALRMAPEVLRRPRWIKQYLQAGGPPDLSVPNMTRPGETTAPGFFDAYGEWMMTALPSWDDIGWLRAQWDGPFIVKGITRPEDAIAAADAGVSGISVSNHGGNNLDGTPASIRALPGVVDAVGDRVEIVLDGGIRRGSDVVKAVALGARAVLIGRAALWGLAANGETGVGNVLEILRAGIQETLAGIGRESIHDVTADDVLVPDGFVRRPLHAAA